MNEMLDEEAQEIMYGDKYYVWVKYPEGWFHNPYWDNLHEATSEIINDEWSEGKIIDFSLEPPLNETVLVIDDLGGFLSTLMGEM